MAKFKDKKKTINNDRGRAKFELTPDQTTISHGPQDVKDLIESDPKAGQITTIMLHWVVSHRDA